MKEANNTKKDRLLGMPHGTANNKLRKSIIFQLIAHCNRNVCYRCRTVIKDMDELSIEHKAPWQSAPDPKLAFFDLNNIAFSHLQCNILARDTTNCGIQLKSRTHCNNGHLLEGNNLRLRTDGRACKTCNKERMQKQRSIDPDYGR